VQFCCRSCCSIVDTQDLGIVVLFIASSRNLYGGLKITGLAMNKSRIDFQADDSSVQFWPMSH
jgi:hypothetical protein